MEKATKRTIFEIAFRVLVLIFGIVIILEMHGIRRHLNKLERGVFSIEQDISYQSSPNLSSIERSLSSIESDISNIEIDMDYLSKVLP